LHTAKAPIEPDAICQNVEARVLPKQRLYVPLHPCAKFVRDEYAHVRIQYRTQTQLG
jgi:hypothetical protein